MAVGKTRCRTSGGNGTGMPFLLNLYPQPCEGKEEKEEGNCLRHQQKWIPHAQAPSTKAPAHVAQGPVTHLGEKGSGMSPILRGGLGGT